VIALPRRRNPQNGRTKFAHTNAIKKFQGEKMNILLTPLKLKDKTIPNRFTAQAMEGNDAINGIPSERTIERYRNLAKGAWGMVIVEAVSAVETSIARKNALIINRKNLDAFKSFVDIFKKENPDALLIFQVTHSGQQSGPFSERVAVEPNAKDCRYLSTDEMEKIKDAFVQACLLSQEAGADGVDFKMCHGYMGSEILRPRNTRPDKWGGSFENRIRFLKEGVVALKDGLKTKDFIIGSRLSFYEGIRGGCGTSGPDEIVEDLSEMLAVVKTMDALNMDYVNVSAGVPALTNAITRPTQPSAHLAYHQLRYTKTVKDLIEKEKLNLKAIGSAYSTYKEASLDFAAEMLSKNYADLCGFGRQTFADPLLPKKYAAGEKINWCILCSGCSKLMANQINDGCIIYNDYYKELMKKAGL
jgi:2,4-dienoyl-CoA reductase-like NADH-dependent reductase (Old Yellow Enzyme family)